MFAVGVRTYTCGDINIQFEHDITRLPPIAKVSEGNWTRTPLAYRESNNVYTYVQQCLYLRTTRSSEIFVNFIFKHVHHYTNFR